MIEGREGYFDEQPSESADNDSHLKPEQNESYFNYAYEYGLELADQPAEGRNFEISVLYPNEKTGQFADLVLETTEHERIPISSLIPPGFQLEFGEDYVQSPKSKKVIVPIDKIGTRGFFLCMLHEIGHAWRNEEDEAKRRQLGQEGTASVVAKLRERGIQDEHLYQELMKVDVQELLPNWYEEQKQDISAQAERGAWTISLRFLRDFEKQGVNVLAGFQSFQEVKEMVDWYLSTYELTRYLNRPETTESERENYQTKFVSSWQRFHDSVLEPRKSSD